MPPIAVIRPYEQRFLKQVEHSLYNATFVQTGINVGEEQLKYHFPGFLQGS